MQGLKDLFVDAEEFGIGATELLAWMESMKVIIFNLAARKGSTEHAVQPLEK